MADESIDPRRANIAMGLAVTRWRRLPDDSIAQKLDDPQEWLQEAALMNHFLPAHLSRLGFLFVAVTANEFSVGIARVRQYAGLIYKHMTPITATLDIHEVASGQEFEEAAHLQSKRSPSELADMAGEFVTNVSNLRIFGGE